MNLEIKYDPQRRCLSVYIDGTRTVSLAANAEDGSGNFPDYRDYLLAYTGPGYRQPTLEEAQVWTEFLGSEVMDLLKWWNWTRGLRGGELTPPASDPALQAALGRIAELKMMPGYPRPGARYSVELTPEMVDALLKIRT